MVQVNGAAARLVAKGDKVIVVTYATYDEAELENYEPVVVHVDEDNRRVSVDNEVAKLLGSSVVRRPARALAADQRRGTMSSTPSPPRTSPSRAARSATRRPTPTAPSDAR